MKRRRVAMTISIPPEIAKDYEWLAQKEAKNRSQLFRDMFLLYKEQALEKEFFELQRYGAKLAKLEGILTEKDVYNGPQNLDSVISYTWEIKGGGPSGTNAKEVSAFI